MIKHLNKGDAEPEVNEGKVTAFVYKFCPFSSRVRLVLLHHKIEHDLVFINIKNPPEWYKEHHNPRGTVPFIELEKQKLGDSEMICQFLDQMCPDCSLLDESCLEVAQGIWKNLFKAWHVIHFEDACLLTDAVKEEYLAGLQHFEANCKGPFLSGDAVRLGDYFLYPLLDTVEATLELLQLSETLTSMNKSVSNWLYSMRALDPVKDVSLPKDVHVRYSQAEKLGCPDPDNIQ